MCKKKRLPIISELHQVINQPEGQKTAISQRPVVPKSLESNLEAKGIKAKALLNQGEPMWNLELLTWGVTVGNWSRLPSTISFRSGEIVCVKSVFVSCLLVSCHEKISTEFCLFFHMWNLTARILDVPFQPISVQNSYLAETFWLPSWCYQTTFQVVVIKVQGLQFWPNFCDVVLEIMRKRREKRVASGGGKYSMCLVLVPKKKQNMTLKSILQFLWCLMLHDGHLMLSNKRNVNGKITK